MCIRDSFIGLYSDEIELHEKKSDNLDESVAYLITERESIMKEEKEMRSKLLSSNLASAILSLFVSLLNKQNPLKYKSFLIILVKCSSFLMINENFRRSYRKQGAIKNMIKIIKDVLNLGKDKQQNEQSNNQDIKIDSSQILSEHIDLIAYIIDFFS